MRISTVMSQRLGVNAILDRQSELSRTQQQLALGKKILTPSDDPTGSAITLGLKQEEKLTGQYQANIDRGISQLNIEEGVLIGMNNTLQRIRELAVQGLNSSLGAENSTALAEEVWQRLDELVSLANTRDGNGDYVFSGYQGTTQTVVDAGGGVFNYQGDQGQKFVQVNATRQMATNDTGFELFFDLPFSGGGKQDIFRTVYDLATAMQTNTLTNGAVLDDLDTAMDSTYSIRAELGARLNALDTQKEINAQREVQIASLLSEINDLDFAEAIGRFNLELAGLQASQQSYTRIQNLSLFNFL